MADPRFHQRSGPLSLRDLAVLGDATLVGGDPEALIQDVASLADAKPDCVAFLDNPKYRDDASTTRAGACLIRAADTAFLPATVARLVTDTPYRGYARIAAAFYHQPGIPAASGSPDTEVAPSAAVDPSATVGAGCQIEPGAVIGAQATLGERCRVGANTVIGTGVVIGADSVVGPGVSITHSLIGERVVIHAGARIGQDGFGFALGAGGHLKVAQLGRVLIGDDVEIGANTAVDRGSGPDTVIERGCKIDNLVMIAHNVRLGRDCVVVAQSGISGSTQIGAGSVLAAQVGVIGHLTIGAGVTLAARAAVTHDLEAGTTWGGVPAVPVRQWRRQVAALRRLAKRGGRGEGQ